MKRTKIVAWVLVAILVAVVALGVYYFSNIAKHADVGNDGHEGRVILFLGSRWGLEKSPAWTQKGEGEQAHLGWSACSAGDVNGDGFSDVLVGAPDNNTNRDRCREGRTYLYLGSARGLSQKPAWTKEGSIQAPCLGDAVSAAGDVNGDGYSDVLVQAYCSGRYGEQNGTLYLFLGSKSGLWDSPAWQIRSDQKGDQKYDIGASYSFSSAGDANGDGYSDVLVGDGSWSGKQTREGKCMIFLGSPKGLSETPAWTSEGNQKEEFFGNAVTAAGDVNHDGYGDVLISQGWEMGRVSLFLGSPSGMGSAPAWTAESDQKDAHFGNHIASAGDINGDGFDDVIIGASWFDNEVYNDGRAFLYLGGQTGLGAAPAWSVGGHALTGYLGCSVASAGDVNKDGFSDVIIGEGNGEGEGDDEMLPGKAYLFLGSRQGLPKKASWVVSGSRQFDHFGTLVRSAGDVNGDGYSDLIIGAWFHSN